MHIKRTASVMAASFGLVVAVPALASAATTITPTNFNTHSGADYKGVNVGFDVTSDEPLSSVKVELLDDGEVLVTNIGTEMLNTLHSPGGTTELSTPFITYYGTYDTGDPYWQFGEWTSVEAPDTARITVNGAVVQNTNLVEPNGWAFDTLLPELNGENFNTHSGTDYEGVNVGFNVAGYETLESVEVKLLDADGNTLITNTGTEDLFALYDSGETQFSTPFVTELGTYDLEADTYWNFGSWSSYAKPVTAVITVNGETVEITPLTEANGVEFSEIVPPAPTSKNACKNGGWKGYYKNQGQCVSEFASKNKGGNSVVDSFKNAVLRWL